MKAMPKKKTSVRSPWTKDDIRQLKAYSKAKTPVVDVAKAMKRTEAAVRQKAKTISIGTIALRAIRHPRFQASFGSATFVTYQRRSSIRARGDPFVEQQLARVLFETARPRYIGEEAVDRVVGRSMSLTRTHRLCWCDR
jgi:hypothetical protein